MAFGRGDLLKKLNGKRIELTTRCKSFENSVGVVKDVFDDFFMFMTSQNPGDNYPVRNMVMFENIAIITQVPEVLVEDIKIER